MFQKYKNFKRYQTIAGVLLRHGFHEFVENSNLAKYLVFRKKAIAEAKAKQAAAEKISGWKRIRLVLEELGPAYVKLGQFLSNRPDLLPHNLCEELEFLLDSVAPFDAKDAVRVVEKELGAPIGEIFSKFSEQPISSASIAQVHKATLHNGSEVAVKIQRPGIRRIIEADLEIMTSLAGFMEKFSEGLKALDPIGIVKEFKSAIMSELDFTIEASSIERFRDCFQNEKGMKVPQLFREYCTKHVMVMEFINGVKISQLLSEPNSGFDLLLIADRMTDAILRQVFEFGFFHADPHPANIMVLEDNVICFLDFGLMGVLLPKHKEHISNMIIGLVNHDSRRITNAVIKLSRNTEIENKENLEFEILKIMEQYSHLQLKDVNMGNFLSDLLKLIINNHLKIPPDMYLLAKSMIAIESLARKIMPDFNMVKHMEPFVRKLIYENISPKRIIKDVMDSATNYAELLYDLPSEIREILTQFKNKNFKIQFEHKGLEPMLKKHDQISNRIAYAIVTASMIIGSSLILHANMAPRIHGLSIVGIVTFFFSVIMGLFLLITIIRHGRM